MLVTPKKVSSLLGPLISPNSKTSSTVELPRSRDSYRALLATYYRYYIPAAARNVLSDIRNLCTRISTSHPRETPKQL